jgi:hypothetical protein
VSTTMNCGAVPIGMAAELIGVDRTDCEDAEPFSGFAGDRVVGMYGKYGRGWYGFRKFEFEVK